MKQMLKYTNMAGVKGTEHCSVKEKCKQRMNSNVEKSNEGKYVRQFTRNLSGKRYTHA